MSELEAILEETTRRQRLAATPDLSAWVAANAGSGKTKVLTDRVMRLLLAGNQPSKLLCITFTKAAAAEMADRLFRRLGEWALMADEELQEELHRLDGGARRSPDDLSEARRLFARALETPGGLKIQTIHSFCESVLKRFPLEAGISPGFKVMEESEAQATTDRIVNTLAERIWAEGGDLLADFRLLTDRLQEDDIRRHIAFIATRGSAVERAIHEAGGREAFFANLAHYLGTDAETTRDGVIGALQGELAGFMDFAANSIGELTDGGHGKWDIATGEKLRVLLGTQDTEDWFAAACNFALTGTGTISKQMSTKSAQKAIAGLAERLLQAAEKIYDAAETLKGVDIFATTGALYRLALHVHEDYEAEKARRGVLDFDDLIAATAALFHDRAATWVLYKLDQGIDHLLVDEAQDTSDGQWQVIDGPLAEFFAGQGTDDKERTVFVVGDEKQSIYSFQGADVALFNSQQKALFDRVTAVEKRFEVQPLDVSFRSTPPVLKFVDELFNDPLAASGVSEEAALEHKAFRAGQAGHVELWPLIVKEKAESGNLWDKPLDEKGTDDPSRILAQHIAGTIKGWLDRGEILTAKGRTIRPGDVLILCQRRGALFHEIVRELIAKGVPTAGSDRVRLMDHVAARDLLSATRFALQPQDDLSLAELLKSPLFGLGDDDLFAITRGEDGVSRNRRSLWRCLLSQKDGRYRAIAQKLEALVSTGLNYGPYAFYTALLEEGEPSGWKRFYSRLGPGARDVLQEMLSEALTWENANPRSLQGFLAHLEGLETELKKELGGDEDVVRIMTVHGSKGLEAPIVFMADAAYSNYNKVSGPVPLGETAHGSYIPQPGYFALLPAKTACNDAALAARDHAVALRAEEYRRLLYVAATRAEDRLYICGTLPGNGRMDSFLGKPSNDCSWYALADRAFARLEEAGEAQRAAPIWSGEIRTLSSPQTAPVKDSHPSAEKKSYEPPAWLRQAAPVEKGPRMISPSTLGGPLEMDPDAPTAEPAAITPLAAAPAAAGEGSLTPYTRGNALHLLLEHLADLAPAERERAAQRLLIRHFPDLASHHAGWTQEALAVLSDPAFGDVFAPGSRAEVPLIGAIGETVISGQIDRLAVSDTRVLIVDYKTNRAPPEKAEDAPRAYVAQLAAYRRLMQEIYPEHQIECALLWTFAARLMPIPEEMLDHALVRALKALATDEKA